MNFAAANVCLVVAMNPLNGITSLSHFHCSILNNESYGIMTDRLFRHFTQLTVILSLLEFHLCVARKSQSLGYCYQAWCCSRVKAERPQS